MEGHLLKGIFNIFHYLFPKYWLEKTMKELASGSKLDTDSIKDGIH